MQRERGVLTRPGPARQEQVEHRCHESDADSQGDHACPVVHEGHGRRMARRTDILFSGAAGIGTVFVAHADSLTR